MADPVYNNVKEDEPVNVGVPQVATGGAIIAPSGVPFKGNASVVPSKFSQSGINQVAIGVGKDIQDAINAMHAAGGGKVFLGAGTHIVTTPLVGYTGVSIEGENQSTTFIDFNNTAANLSCSGTDVYTTGTITSITSGVNVTGSGTSWLTNVTTDHQIFIGNLWYKIAAVTGDTTLILGEGYAGGASLPGASYRAAKVVKDVELKEFTIKNSTGTGLVFSDCRNITFEDFQVETNNKGIVFNNSSDLRADAVWVAGNTSNGVEYNTCGFGEMEGMMCLGNGGHGCLVNDLTISVFSNSAFDGNTSDGLNISSVVNLLINGCDTSGNGGQGIELVSNNIDLVISSLLCKNNISDGIKLTATSDNVIISASTIKGSGGYGINIAASTCDNNLISASIFDNNTSGDINDLGTGTLISACIPDSINTGGSPSSSKFGGDGSDGALSSSSGTTTINCSNAAVVIKNYSNISLTGTADLAFSNPNTNGTIVILKSQGNVTITSSASPAISLVGMGANGGQGNSGSDGSTGNDANASAVGALGANGGVMGNPGSGGSGTTRVNLGKYLTKIITLSCGSGGGGGASSWNTATTGGYGGDGGGALLIECGGALNITSTLSAAGEAGNVDGSPGNAAGGGGGGGGGSIVILYDTLTANTGTYVVSGGAGGAAGSGTDASRGGSGGGGGGNTNNGATGTTTVTTSGAAGGAGGAGFSLIVANTEFA